MRKDSLVTNSLESVLRTPVKSVSVGVRPSGDLHIGNLVTMTLAGLAAARAKAELHLTICDIDLPDQNEKRSSAQYFKYQKMEDATRAELTAAQIREYTAALAMYLGIPMRIDFLSDVQRQKGYRQGLARLLENREELVELYTGRKNSNDKAVPIYPVCGKCHHTPIERALHLEENRLRTRCKNENCEKYKEPRIIELYDRTQELGVHYFMDPIRDVMLKPRADLHVFGGDYLNLHGGFSKVEKVCRITELTGENPPNYLIGPLLIGPNNDKMSKSSGAKITLRALKETYNGLLAEKLTGFTETAVKNGCMYVPHQTVAEHFKIADSKQNHPPSEDSLELSLASS